MSAIKETVPEHSSDGRVTRAGSATDGLIVLLRGARPTIANEHGLCTHTYISSYYAHIWLSAGSHCFQADFFIIASSAVKQGCGLILFGVFACGMRRASGIGELSKSIKNL